MPRTGAGAHALTGNELTRLIWIWLASGDVGTAVGSPATRAEVIRYIQAYTDPLSVLR